MDFYIDEETRFDYIRCLHCGWKKSFVTDNEFMLALDQFRRHECQSRKSSIA